MRFIRVLVVIGLLGSLALNLILYMKFRGSRPIFSVNGDGVTRRDFDSHLEQQAGPTAKALFVERILVNQEAKKLGVTPTQAEVDEEFNRRREELWQFARQVDMNPWIAGEAKKQIQQEFAKVRILAKEVPVTEDEMQEEYRQNASKYDTPAKAKTNLAVVLNANLVSDIKQLLEKKNPPVSPTVIMSQYKAGVTFLGHENKFIFSQPLGNTKYNADVFKMQPGQVRQFPPGEFQKSGAKAIIVRMEGITPGKKADLNDPKTKEKLKVAVASRRWKPWQEKLSEMWVNATFTGENPDDKKNIEWVLFPDQARAAANK